MLDTARLSFLTFIALLCVGLFANPALAACAAPDMTKPNIIVCTGIDTDGYENFSGQLDITVEKDAEVNNTNEHGIWITDGVPDDPATDVDEYVPQTLLNLGTIKSDVGGIRAGSYNVITNKGTIIGNDFGIEVDEGNIIYNSGTIRSNYHGIKVTLKDNIVINSGTIEAFDGITIHFPAEDVFVHVTEKGRIIAEDHGINGWDDNTIVIDGTIEAGGTGVSLRNRNLILINGEIIAANVGVQLHGSGNRLVNSGTITGDQFGVVGLIANRAPLGNLIINTGIIEAVGGDAGEPLRLSDRYDFEIEPDCIGNKCIHTIYGIYTDELFGSRLQTLVENDGIIRAIPSENGQHPLMPGAYKAVAIHDGAGQFWLRNNSNGVITSDIELGAGDDIVELAAGGVINGNIDLGTTEYEQDMHTVNNISQHENGDEHIVDDAHYVAEDPGDYNTADWDWVDHDKDPKTAVIKVDRLENTVFTPVKVFAAIVDDPKTEIDESKGGTAFESVISDDPKADSSVDIVILTDPWTMTVDLIAQDEKGNVIEDDPDTAIDESGPDGIADFELDKDGKVVNRTLVQERALVEGVYDGNITEAELLYKRGISTWTLNGNVDVDGVTRFGEDGSLWTEATAIEQGRLNINGTLNSPVVNILPDGILGGDGTVITNPGADGGNGGVHVTGKASGDGLFMLPSTDVDLVTQYEGPPTYGINGIITVGKYGLDTPMDGVYVLNTATDDDDLPDDTKEPETDLLEIGDITDKEKGDGIPDYKMVDGKKVLIVDTAAQDKFLADNALPENFLGETYNGSFETVDTPPFRASIAPGNSIGTLNVVGNVTFDSYETAFTTYETSTQVPVDLIAQDPITGDPVPDNPDTADVDESAPDGINDFDMVDGKSVDRGVNEVIEGREVVTNWGGRFEADLNNLGENDLLAVTKSGVETAIIAVKSTSDDGIKVVTYEQVPVDDGLVTLGGLLDIMLEPGDYDEESMIYDIITAEGGIDGEFDFIGFNTWTFDAGANDGAVASLDENGNQVRDQVFKGFLEYQTNLVRIISIPSFGPFGKTDNQANFGSYLDTFSKFGLHQDEMTMTLAYLGLRHKEDAGAYSMTVNWAIPELYNAYTEVAISQAKGIMGQGTERGLQVRHGDRLDLSVTDYGNDTAVGGSGSASGLSFWVSGSWNNSEVSSKNGSVEYEFDGITSYLGADYLFAENWLVGLIASMGDTDVHYDVSDISGGKADTWSIGVYASYADHNGYYANVGGGRGELDMDTIRNGEFTVLDQVFGGVAESSHDGKFTYFYGEVGRSFETANNWHIAPEIGLLYTKVKQDGINEVSTGLLGLTVDAQSHASLRGIIQVRADKSFGKTLVHGGVGIAKEFKDDLRAMYAMFAHDTSGNGFATFGDVPRDITAIVDLGVSHQVSEMVSLQLDYAGEFGSNFQSHNVMGSLNLAF